VNCLDRFQGCLVGLAVGNALGAPVEGMDATEIERQHGRVTELIGGGWLGLEPGAWTDDTAMMLCIARSIVGKGRFDPQDTAEKFFQWFDTNPAGIGQTTWLAMEAFGEGASWNEAGRMAHARLGGLSAGNGSIMRCAPIALLDGRDPERLTRDSIDSSLITHLDPRACWGAVAVNLAISHLVYQGNEGLIETISAGIDQPDVRKAVVAVPQMERDDVVPSAFVLDTLQAALWSFLKTTSFEDALVTAVNLGGDADTVAAVCGSMAGAHYGLRAVPSRWLERLVGKSEIVELAEKIHRLAQA